MAYKLENTAQIIESMNQKIKTADDLISQLGEASQQMQKVDGVQRETKAMIDGIIAEQQLIHQQVTDSFEKQNITFSQFIEETKQEIQNLEEYQKNQGELVVKYIDDKILSTDEHLKSIEKNIVNHIEEAQKTQLKALDYVEQKMMNQILQLQVDLDRKMNQLKEMNDQYKDELNHITTSLSKKIKATHLTLIILGAVLFACSLIIILI